MAATTPLQEQARNAVACDVHMISGSRDSQTSSDVFDVGAFALPDPAGKAGGACTSALLKVLYNQNKRPRQRQQSTSTAAPDAPSWAEVLRQMRQVLREMRYDQVPQLTSSRLVDVNKPMAIIPPNFAGTKRAVLIGINYVGQRGELRGCHNDVRNVERYLREEHGFRDITILMDDDDSGGGGGTHASPTKRNILGALERAARQSRSGDALFVQYSGHGGRLRDRDGDEDDGYDETLIPLDYKKRGVGHIRDDDLLRVLIRPIPAGVTVTCLMDSCHSGTVLDLPYKFTAAGGNKMGRNEKFRESRFQIQQSSMRCCCSWLLLNATNFVAFMINFAVTYGLGAYGVSDLPTNAELSEKYQTIITPVGWSFFIWGLIFLSQLIWASAQISSYHSHPLVQNGVRWYYLAVCATQICWTITFTLEFIVPSVVMMLFILLYLIRIVVSQYHAQTTNVPPCDYILLKFPFAIHAGWIIAASLVNVSVLLVYLDVGANGQYYVALASLIGILIIAGAVLFYPARPEYTIPLVLAWALVGIYVELGNPQESITNTFGSERIAVVRYGALAACGVIVSLAAFTLVRACWRKQKRCEDRGDDAKDYGAYRTMAEV